ncbi:MAG TPA: sugar kinase [Actinokineospora sp.]|nr:sugar kinase [Actinokineospora sp.]
MTLDLVTFGEVMGLLVAPPGEPLRQATTFHRSFAGAEATVAVGLARLGHRTGWFGRFGDDQFGHAGVDVLRGEGVDVSRVAHDPDAPTGLLVRDAHAVRRISVQYHRAGSAASRMTADDIDADYLASARILHVTGITPALSPGCLDAVAEAMRVAREEGVVVSFDPNYRRRLWSTDEAANVLRPLIDYVDLVFTGPDEAQLLTGEHHPDVAARALIHRGARLVVVKNGAQGAWATDGEREWTAPALPAAVVDPVGAGDAFNAGFLSGWLRDEPVESSLRRGAACGALSVQTLGDLAGLPYPDDLAAILDASDVDR